MYNFTRKEKKRKEKKRKEKKRKEKKKRWILVTLLRSKNNASLVWSVSHVIMVAHSTFPIPIPSPSPPPSPSPSPSPSACYNGGT